MSQQANGNPTPPPPPAPPPSPPPPSGPGRMANDGRPTYPQPPKAFLAGALALLAILLGLSACQPGTPVPQESPHPLQTGRQVAP